MFRKIQARGRSLRVVCPPEEWLALCRQLQPQGLALMTGGLPPPKLNELFEVFCGA